MGRKLTWLALSLLLFISVSAQHQSSLPAPNLRTRMISTRADTVQVDSLSIVPGSFSLAGVPDSGYVLDEPGSRLVWKVRPKPDSVRVNYRVFDFSFSRDYYHKDLSKLFQSYVFSPYVYQGGVASASRFIDFGNLNYNGSLARGISFGNTQDVVVNSNLNLQLSGILADSILLVAAISDNNIPFQPEGNTENLQNLDKVFIQFSRQRTSLILGDYDQQQSQSHFMHFYQRMEGISAHTAFSAGSPRDSNSLEASGAVTKGKFAQDIFQGEEGNQGPYHLTGANGEQYVIALAGTERVFLNGVLMRRGQDQDYIIDYNTAEITFTPKNLITHDTRIQVEFEYTDNSYLNSQLYLSDSWYSGDRLKLTLNAYSNQDARNAPVSQPLSADQIFFLGRVGDSISKAYFPSVSRDTFSSSQVQYALIDTLVGGKIYDSVFRYSTNPDSASYALAFTLVGQGNGNYVPLANGANGQAYQWVAPLNGVAQGSYAPVVLLITPKKQQLFTLGGDYRISAHSSFSTELALSNNDVNLFSRIQKSGDLGGAASARFQSDRPFSGTGPGETDLFSSVSYEFTARNFKALEPFRNVEFYRDWSLGLNSVLPREDEQLVQGTLGIRKNGIGTLSYAFSGFFRGADFSGFRNILSAMATRDGFTLNGQFNITSGSGLEGNSRFLRPRLDFSKSFKKLDGITLGTGYALEDNRILDPRGDSLSFQSFSYQDWQFYLKTPDADRNRISLTYTLRTDRYPRLTQMIKGDLNRILNLSGQLGKNPHDQLRWNFTYHNLAVSDSALSGQQAGQGLLGRLEWLVNTRKGFLTSSTVYETGTGQQPRQSFTYVQVPAGQGDYVWIDYNHDSIQQVNEFQKAIYKDQGNFIRVYTPSGQYVRANYIQLNQSIALNPKQLFPNRTLKGFPALISRFSSQSSLQVNRNLQDGGLSRFNPFGPSVQDSSLISTSSLITNAVFFNRLSQVWNLDYTNTNSANKFMMNYGFESEKTSRQMFHGRWNFSRRFSAEMNWLQGMEADYSPSYANLNYQVSELEILPRVDYTYGSTMRITFSYTRDRKADLPSDGGETSLSQAISAELKYNVLTASTLDILLTYDQIRFQGLSTSTVAYTMLDGLLPGTNLLWQVNYTRRIAGNLEIDLQYQGRKPGAGMVIHNGQISARALF